MSDDNTLHCGEHGPASPTYVCQHLAANPAQRWICDYPSADNPWPDAWCESCDGELRKDGEWNDRNEAFADIKLMCHHCYEQGMASSISAVEKGREDEWRAAAQECMEELKEKQAALERDFGLSTYERWDYDQETAQLVFSIHGAPALVASIEMIGSLSTQSNTWLWSWANFHFLPQVVGRVESVRDFGEEYDFPRLTVPKWPADQYDGWEMAAFAARILQAAGVYRAPVDNGFVFMALFDLQRPV